MRHLRSVLELTASVATAHEKRRYRDARAWLYYLGAFEERRKTPSSPSRHSVIDHRRSWTRDQWFQRRLAQHVRERERSPRRTGGGVDSPSDLRTSPARTSLWPEWRRIFRTFFLVDWARPNGSKWFDNVVASQAYLDS
ncbi:hypothetical protein CLAIMM_14693 [Cladophialophora immunda]|nr:hypothetical protein CLAIMM_14693 [Cladophialophora immunda]